VNPAAFSAAQGKNNHDFGRFLVRLPIDDINFVNNARLSGF